MTDHPGVTATSPSEPVESREQPSATEDELQRREKRWTPDEITGLEWPDEDLTPWPENAWGTPGQITHRLRIDADFRGRFVAAAISNQARAETCWHGFHEQRLDECTTALAAALAEVSRLREQGGLELSWLLGPGPPRCHR